MFTQSGISMFTQSEILNMYNNNTFVSSEEVIPKLHTRISAMPEDKQNNISKFLPDLQDLIGVMSEDNPNDTSEFLDNRPLSQLDSDELKEYVNSKDTPDLGNFFAMAEKSKSPSVLREIENNPINNDQQEEEEISDTTSKITLLTLLASSFKKVGNLAVTCLGFFVNAAKLLGRIIKCSVQLVWSLIRKFTRGLYEIMNSSDGVGTKIKNMFSGFWALLVQTFTCLKLDGIFGKFWELLKKLTRWVWGNKMTSGAIILFNWLGGLIKTGKINDPRYWQAFKTGLTHLDHSLSFSMSQVPSLESLEDVNIMLKILNHVNWRDIIPEKNFVGLYDYIKGNLKNESHVEKNAQHLGQFLNQLIYMYQYTEPHSDYSDAVQWSWNNTKNLLDKIQAQQSLTVSWPKIDQLIERYYFTSKNNIVFTELPRAGGNLSLQLGKETLNLSGQGLDWLNKVTVQSWTRYLSLKREWTFKVDQVQNLLLGKTLEQLHGYQALVSALSYFKSIEGQIGLKTRDFLIWRDVFYQWKLSKMDIRAMTSDLKALNNLEYILKNLQKQGQQLIDSLNQEMQKHQTDMTLSLEKQNEIYIKHLDLLNKFNREIQPHLKEFTTEAKKFRKTYNIDKIFIKIQSAITQQGLDLWTRLYKLESNIQNTINVWLPYTKDLSELYLHEENFWQITQDYVAGKNRTNEIYMTDEGDKFFAQAKTFMSELNDLQKQVKPLTTQIKPLVSQSGTIFTKMHFNVTMLNLVDVFEIIKSNQIKERDYFTRHEQLLVKSQDLLTQYQTLKNSTSSLKKHLKKPQIVFNTVNQNLILLGQGLKERWSRLEKVYGSPPINHTLNTEYESLKTQVDTFLTLPGGLIYQAQEKLQQALRKNINIDQAEIKVEKEVKQVLQALENLISGSSNFWSKNINQGVLFPGQKLGAQLEIFIVQVQQAIDAIQKSININEFDAWVQHGKIRQNNLIKLKRQASLKPESAFQKELVTLENLEHTNQYFLKEVNRWRVIPKFITLNQAVQFEQEFKNQVIKFKNKDLELIQLVGQSTQNLNYNNMNLAAGLWHSIWKNRAEQQVEHMVENYGDAQLILKNMKDLQTQQFYGKLYKISLIVGLSTAMFYGAHVLRKWYKVRGQNIPKDDQVMPRTIQITSENMNQTQVIQKIKQIFSLQPTTTKWYSNNLFTRWFHQVMFSFKYRNKDFTLINNSPLTIEFIIPLSTNFIQQVKSLWQENLKKYNLKMAIKPLKSSRSLKSSKSSR